jgi:hypothetical protein
MIAMTRKKGPSVAFDVVTSFIVSPACRRIVAQAGTATFDLTPGLPTPAAE